MFWCSLPPSARVRWNLQVLTQVPILTQLPSSFYARFFKLIHETPRYLLQFHHHYHFSCFLLKWMGGSVPPSICNKLNHCWSTTSNPFTKRKPPLSLHNSAQSTLFQPSFLKFANQTFSPMPLRNLLDVFQWHSLQFESNSWKYSTGHCTFGRFVMEFETPSFLGF